MASADPVRLVAATRDGATPFHLVSAGTSQDRTVVKAAPGQVYGLTLSNTNAAARYVKLYDKATNPASTDTPALSVQVPANGSRDLAFPAGMAFANGIGLRITTGAADNDANGAGAADVLADLTYQ
jgi:hypothetical protein